MPAARVLVLGATGFAGGHFAEAARDAGLEVVTAARWSGAADVRCDLLEPDSISAALAESSPAGVVNLAGAASVGRSWSDPAGAFAVNAAGVVNLLDAVAAGAADTHVVCVSSGEVYGAVDDRELPIGEGAPVRPLNPYATSKAAMELVCGQYARSHGLPIAVMRSFNHLGPGQSDAFAASSFARQIAAAEAAGRDRVELRTGDLSPQRDFTDVRDVVRAYVLTVERGLTGAFNVCGGEPVRLEALVTELARHAKLEVGMRVDEQQLRPAEAPRLYGSYGRLEEATAWSPEIPLTRTLADLLDWWRGQV